MRLNCDPKQERRNVKRGKRDSRSVRLLSKSATASLNSSQFFRVADPSANPKRAADGDQGSTN
jgi:hypothetical protein